MPLLTDKERQKLKDKLMEEFDGAFAYNYVSGAAIVQALAALDNVESQRRTAEALEKLVNRNIPGDWEPVPLNLSPD